MARFAIEDGAPVIIDKWYAFDIIERAKEINDADLTLNDAAIIMQRMVKRHDCEQGINWDVIDYHIDELLEELEAEEMAS